MSSSDRIDDGSSGHRAVLLRKLPPTPANVLYERQAASEAFLAQFSKPPSAAAAELQPTHPRTGAQAFLVSLDEISAPATAMDPALQRTASAYGVTKSLTLESKLNALQRRANPTGVPSSGWRRATELERKLEAASRAQAASRLQVALLREESRRKGKRIAQLEDLLAELEKDYRTVRARLSSLDSSVEAAHGGASRWYAQATIPAP